MAGAAALPTEDAETLRGSSPQGQSKWDTMQSDIEDHLADGTSAIPAPPKSVPAPGGSFDDKDDEQAEQALCTILNSPSFNDAVVKSEKGAAIDKGGSNAVSTPRKPKRASKKSKAAGLRKTAKQDQPSYPAVPQTPPGAVRGCYERDGPSITSKKESPSQLREGTNLSNTSTASSSHDHTLAEGEARSSHSSHAPLAKSALDKWEQAEVPIEASLSASPTAAKGSKCLPASQSPRSVHSARSGRSAGSGMSHRSGMTDAEVDEMRVMALRNSKRALREALLSLQGLWSKYAAVAPKQESVQLRKRFEKTKGLKSMLRAANECAISDPKSGLELALLWERCRVRGMIALAIQLSDSAMLREALRFSTPLGLKVELERELCCEWEDRVAMANAVSSAPSEVSSANEDQDEGEEEMSENQEGNATADEDANPDNGAPQTGATIAGARPQPRTRWWQRLFRRQSPVAAQWEGEEGLKRAMQDHIRRGNAPMPKELAVDLGLNSLSPNKSSKPQAGPLGMEGLLDDSPPSRAAVADGSAAARLKSKNVHERSAASSAMPASSAHPLGVAKARTKPKT